MSSKSWIVLFIEDFQGKQQQQKSPKNFLSITPFFHKLKVIFCIIQKHYQIHNHSSVCWIRKKKRLYKIIYFIILLLFHDKPILSRQMFVYICFIDVCRVSDHWVLCSDKKNIQLYIYHHTYTDIFLFKCISVFVLSSSSIICVFVNVWCSYYKCAASFISFFILIINEGKKKPALCRLLPIFILTALQYKYIHVSQQHILCFYVALYMITIE